MRRKSLLEIVQLNKYLLLSGGFIYDVSLDKAKTVRESELRNILGIRSLKELLKDSTYVIPESYERIVYLEQSKDKDAYLLHLIVFLPNPYCIVIKEGLVNGNLNSKSGIGLDE